MSFQKSFLEYFAIFSYTNILFIRSLNEEKNHTLFCCCRILELCSLRQVVSLGMWRALSSRCLCHGECTIFCLHECTRSTSMIFTFFSDTNCCRCVHCTGCDVVGSFLRPDPRFSRCLLEHQRFLAVDHFNHGAPLYLKQIHACKHSCRRETICTFVQNDVSTLHVKKFQFLVLHEELVKMYKRQLFCVSDIRPRVPDIYRTFYRNDLRITENNGAKQTTEFTVSCAKYKGAELALRPCNNIPHVLVFSMIQLSFKCPTWRWTRGHLENTPVPS